VKFTKNIINSIEKPNGVYPSKYIWVKFNSILENVKINGNSKFCLLGCKNCKINNIGSSVDKQKLMFQSYSFLTRDKNSCINMLSIAKYIIYNKGKRCKIILFIYFWINIFISKFITKI
jgi:hypothetical protein